MSPNDILHQLNAVIPDLKVEKYKTMRDSDRALMVTTTNGKELIFTYVGPGVWDICSLKFYKRKGVTK